MRNYWLDKKADREKKVDENGIFLLTDPASLAGFMSKGKKQYLKSLPKVVGINVKPKATKGGILLP